MFTATARACSNMALAKYWGKRDEKLVLPFNGSLSMTLDSLFTETTVEFTGVPGPDQLKLDGADASAGETRRATELIDLVRGGNGAARITTSNNFPTAGGLASSASGFAALAAAASWAAGLNPSMGELSILARRASGSACRSVLGGFVEWMRGQRDDGLDSFAMQVLTPGKWDVAMSIAVVDVGRKETSSRDAMRDSVQTSPYFDAWTKSALIDLEAARLAVVAKDIERLGEIAERSFLRMHATAMTSTPPAIFWKPPTLALIDCVRELRRKGTGAWATIDAGPHVVALCEESDVAKVAKALGQVAGVREVMTARPGPGVERL